MYTWEGSPKNVAIRRYCEFVKAGENQPSPMAELKNQVYLGGDTGILEAYQAGQFSMKEVGLQFGLHYSRVSRIVSSAQRKT